MSLTGKIFESTLTDKAAGKASAISRIASALLLTGAFGLTACTRDYTVAYVYATAAGAGINEYAVDYQSGALVPVPGSPVAAGNNPVKIIASPNGLFIYALNQGDSTIQEFAVDDDNGQLTSKNTYPTGANPTSMVMDPAGKFLYVTFTYQQGYSASNPGPGGVNIFPVNSDFSLGTPTVQPLGNNPVGVVVTSFTPYVYIIDAEPAVASGSPVGWILAFSQNTTNGALTPIGKTNISVDNTGKTVAVGYGAGTNPSAIAADPTSRFVYVTDRSTNQLYGNLVISGGLLQPMQNSPFATGLLPVAVTVDPRGKYMYVANFNSNTVSAYVIDQPTGAPVGSVGSSATSVGTGPSCLSIEPALGVYMYSANNLDNTTTGLKLDAHNGSLQNVQNTPFPAAGTPTCIVAVANGSHATQVVSP
ncbi:lactonase family protein [Edaphobacter modestus]|uniref:6-phosphogluconolactonase (Cycloisomerase 2 family) n=1 Tax=Edaphobacter modestus TaxID=388466 RepID=A0A4Q7YUS1_9BACT|nr:beta-propeller fold lactonase family protein [Edaphobacter modestus]RZU40851.1 6-phosphogluconolactonase (cycloisomerase 2 family) [Edaphobacter modestus]